MRVLPSLGLGILCGCGVPAASPPDFAVPPDLAPAQCHLVNGARGYGAMIPGGAVTLEVNDAGSGQRYAVRWTVPSGSLSSPVGPSVTWTLAGTLARHRAERVTATAVVSAPGCRDEHASAPFSVDWPPSRRVLVIYNPMAKGSLDVAKLYAQFRGLPSEALCAAPAADPGLVQGGDFEAWLKPVVACLDALGPRVHYLVPVWGVPLKVAGRVVDFATHQPATVSLDALLVFGHDAAALKTVEQNPYYQSSDSLDGVYPDPVPIGTFRDGSPDDYYLVARIDGASAAAAQALVDRTAAAEALAQQGKLAGTVYVDGNRGLPHPTTDVYGSYAAGEWNIIGVETVFKLDGRYPIVADYQPAEFGTAPAPLTCPDALHYAGWYSFGHYNDVFAWRPGAVGAHLDSCSACDVRGNTDWSAVALQRGITATFGAVNEPYVAGLPDYDAFFWFLLHGASFGEAGYQASSMAAWMMVFVGDPLYTPYPVSR